jgi:nitroimidazol reductase NimA-like FMN-containing flavoprotein (pyridoxamine 5'-phosphate oxidase superfamily)
LPATIPVTERTKLRRQPARGVFDRDAVYRVLDEGFLCHVAFVQDGPPNAIPTAYARIGDEVVVHGSAASRTARALGGAIDVCITVTMLDGFVLARSGFNHSMNYRSVVILGQAREITDPDEKLRALAAITDQIVPGRWDALRPTMDQELKGTAVLAVPIVEASAKVRSGPPLDAEDASWPVWAGVVPVVTTYGTPVPAPEMAADAALRHVDLRASRNPRPRGLVGRFFRTTSRRS